MSHLSWLMSLSPFIAFSLNCATQLLLARLTSNIAFFVYSGLVIGLVADLSLLYYSFDNANLFLFFSYGFASLVTYLAFSFCYWGFLNLNRTSLRIRILRELAHFKISGLSEEKLMSVYLPQELLNVRLVRLNRTGKIIKNNQNKWEVRRNKSRQLFILASSLAWLRKIIIPCRSLQE